MRLNVLHPEPSIHASGGVNFLGVPHLPHYHFPVEDITEFERIAEEEGYTPYGLLRALFNAVGNTGWYFRQDYRTGEWFLNRVRLPYLYPKRNPKKGVTAGVKGIDNRIRSNLKRLHRIVGFNGFPEFSWVQIRGVVYTKVRPRLVGAKWRWYNQEGEDINAKSTG